MTRLDYTSAKTKFDELFHLAEAGQTTIVVRNNQPPVMISPAKQAQSPHPHPPIKLGLLAGKIHMAPDFNETCEQTIEDWDGAYDDPA